MEKNMIKKIIGIFLLGISLIVGCIWLWLCVFGISLKPLESHIQSSVSENLQANISFQDARLIFGSDITLAVTDLKLSHTAKDFQEDVFLKIPKVVIALSLFSLWENKIEPEVFVESPELFLFKRNDEWALTTLAKNPSPESNPKQRVAKIPPPEKPSAAPPKNVVIPEAPPVPGLPEGWSFMVKNFDLANGKVFLVSPETSRALTTPLTKVNFQVKFFTPEDFKGTLNLADISIAQLMTLAPPNPAQKIITMGGGSLDTKFQGSSIDPAKVKDTLNVEGTLKLNDVQFHGDAAKDVLEQQSTALKVLKMQPPDQKWPQWVIPFTLHQGVFQYEQNISFYEGDFFIKPQIFLKENNRLAGPLSFESNKGDWLGLVVRGNLKGDLAHPGFSIDATSLQSDVLKRGLQKGASDLKDRAQQELEKRPDIHQKLQKYGIDIPKLLNR
jgi:hypothetical protein